LISQVGVKDKMPSSLVFVFKILLKDFKKIKWHCHRLTLKDTSFHSKRESNNLLEDFQTLQKHWIFGLKFKSFGPVCSPFLLEVILPNKCHFKPNNSPVSTKLGWNVCKNQLKQKEFSHLVNWTYLKTIFQICKRD
jgi:hypothetical protein